MGKVHEEIRISKYGVPTIWGFNEIRRSEIVFPWNDMPIAERADLPDMIVLYIFNCIEGDLLSWLSLRVSHG